MLENSTLGGNTASGKNAAGGGIWVNGSVTAINSTISGNRADGDSAEGGGIWSPLEGGISSPFANDELPEVRLRNSILLGNAASGAASGEYVGNLVLRGSNIVGTNVFSGTADVGDTTAAEVFDRTVKIAPGVWAGRLADNGGPTETIALRLGPSNPAVGAADRATFVATDQRGVARDPLQPDLGAFELQGLVLAGGAKSERLSGWIRGDTIYGKGGDDTLRGGSGDDRLLGGSGSDRLVADRGSDGLKGGTGSDTLSAGSGKDRLAGNEGNDGLRGGGASDRLQGGRGSDTVYGGIGSDRLAGDEGNDLLRGDDPFSATSQDRFVFDADFGRDTIADFDANPYYGTGLIDLHEQDRIDLRRLGISSTDFDERVTIADLGRHTLITVVDGGTILCRDVSGRGADTIDETDFLL